MDELLTGVIEAPQAMQNPIESAPLNSPVKTVQRTPESQDNVPSDAPPADEAAQGAEARDATASTTTSGSEDSKDEVGDSPTSPTTEAEEPTEAPTVFPTEAEYKKEPTTPKEQAHEINLTSRNMFNRKHGEVAAGRKQEEIRDGKEITFLSMKTIRDLKPGDYRKDAQNSTDPGFDSINGMKLENMNIVVKVGKEEYTVLSILSGGEKDFICKLKSKDGKSKETGVTVPREEVVWGVARGNKETVLSYFSGTDRELVQLQYDVDAGGVDLLGAKNSEQVDKLITEVGYRTGLFTDADGIEIINNLSKTQVIPSTASDEQRRIMEAENDQASLARKKMLESIRGKNVLEHDDMMKILRAAGVDSKLIGDKLANVTSRIRVLNESLMKGIDLESGGELTKELARDLREKLDGLKAEQEIFGGLGDLSMVESVFEEVDMGTLNSEDVKDLKSVLKTATLDDLMESVLEDKIKEETGKKSNIRHKMERNAKILKGGRRTTIGLGLVLAFMMMQMAKSEKQ